MGSSLFGKSKNDLFGKDVAMSTNGYQLVIGSARSYLRACEWNGSDWGKRGDSIAGVEGSYFGYSISITPDGNLMAIGAVLSEYVEVYEWINSGWTIRGNKLSLVRSEKTWFGNSLDISSNGNILAVGSPKELKKKGRVYVYDWEGSEYSPRSNIWGLEEKKEAGWKVSLSGNGIVLVIGT